MRPKDSHRKTLLWMLIPTSAIVFLFVPLMVQDEIPVFRDAGHFYYPTLHFEHQQWQQGRVPLWNPQDELGRPFAADASVGVFYPGKLIFMFPLAFSTCLVLYTALHLLVAAYTTFRAARYLKATALASIIAAISFSLGGAVLSQHANIIFLVSAAWLPLALLYGLQLIRNENRSRACILLSICLALMLLGGDPQAVVHLIIVLLVCWFILPRCPQHASTPTAPTRLPLKTLLTTLSCVAAITTALTAIQLLPTLEWSQRSERNMRSSSQTVFQWAGDSLKNNNFENEVVAPKTTDHNHSQRVYNFSLPPWQLAELALPNVSGKLYPQRNHWTFLFPDSQSIWFPTIYQGIIPLLLAISVITLRRRKDTIAAMLSWVLMLTLCAALGTFGLGWIWNQIVPTTTIAPTNFSLYWLLTNTIPEYIDFRYPAKWFVLTSLMLALLASRGWDQFVRRLPQIRQHVFPRLVILATIFTLIGIGCIPLSNWIDAKLSGNLADQFLGPVSSSGALRNLFTAPLHALIASIAIISICIWGIFGRWQKYPWAPTLIPLLILLDLLIANHWVIVSAPASHWKKESAVQRITTNSTPLEPIRIYRARSQHWYPPAFAETSSPQRLAEALRWDRQTLRTRLHLLSPYQLLDTNASLSSADYESMLRVMRNHGTRRADGIAEPDLRGLALLGADYFIAPKSLNLHNDEQGDHSPPWPIATDAHLIELSSAYPAAWVTHDWEATQPVTTHSSRELDALSERVFYPNNSFRNFANWTFWETSQPREPTHPELAAAPVKIIQRKVGYLQLETHLDAPGLLIVNQGYAPGWKAKVWNLDNTLPQTREVHRGNRVMQAIWLEPGDHTVELIYQPASFLLGLVISALAWTTLSILFVKQAIKYRKLNLP
ncbi:MAG: YfhO family protein [Pirellulaceae bacterium]